ncbi:nucleotidyltransferase family protein [Nocardioides panacisoli]|uniref:Nucleotidyltransferase family protein n=1 Tax=Nocardioides panacisoli TaxID=627624 RepID=A0ABP7IVR0_9ACTN
MLTPAAVSQVRRAVRSALLVEDGRAPRWQWGGQVPVRDFVAAVDRHRVAQPLSAAAEALALPREVAEPVAEGTRDDRLGAMSQVRAIAAVDTALDGIDHLFFKGAALAVQLTGDLTARGAGDVDVLVDVDDLEAALDRIRAAGWTIRPQHASDPGSWMWGYQRRVAHEIGLEGASGTVDLHWRLDPTYDALPSFAELWSRRERIQVGPVSVATMSRSDAFAHALRHAARDDWGSLRSLVDIHRLARDRAAWPARPDRLARTSLTVTEATVGLPEPVPPFRRVRAGLPRALSAQRRTMRFTRFQGDAALRYTTYCLAGSRSPRDIGVALASLVLPPLRVAHVPEHDAAGAILHGLAARSRPSDAWAPGGDR